MKQIMITRNSSGTVVFQTVSIDASENVFFTNLDPTSEHWPDIATNTLGAAPSANSSQCTVPAPPAGNTQFPFPVTYKCKIPGHENESGTINVVLALSAPPTNAQLANATVGTAIATQQVVAGGLSPYAVTSEFQVVDANGQLIQSGSGVGPGLQLAIGTSAQGISVSGTPTVAGTYFFSLSVTDANQRIFRQPYSMIVKAAS